MGLGSAVIGLLLIREPENSVRIQIEKDQKKELEGKGLKRKATIMKTVDDRKQNFVV